MPQNPAPTGAIELGWFTVCVKAEKFSEVFDFYKKIGFSVSGGQPEHGWVTLVNGSTELAVMGFLQSNLINFRGGDIAALAAELRKRGFALFHQPHTDPSRPDGRADGPRRYDPAQWPASFHTDAQGGLLAIDDAGDFLIEDPDGHLLLFDTVPLERVRYRAGDRFASEKTTGSYASDQLQLGRFVFQLHVADLTRSRAFYERLGLQVTKELPELGYIEMSNGLAIGCTLGLNAKSAPCDVFYFECADLDRIAREASAQELSFSMPPSAHPDGARVAMMHDPAGNTLYFRQPSAR